MQAPWGTTKFKEGYVGDILTSTPRVLIDLIFSVGYFGESFSLTLRIFFQPYADHHTPHAVFYLSTLVHHHFPPLTTIH